MNSIHYILDFAGLRKSRGNHLEFSSAEFFGSLLAGLIHDYKHPGELFHEILFFEVSTMKYIFIYSSLLLHIYFTIS